MGRLTKILQLPTEIQTMHLPTCHPSKFTQSLLLSKHVSGGRWIPWQPVSKYLSLSLKMV